MSHTSIDRPKAEKRKIHSRNEFELCYIRHQYFRKVKFNPSEQEMKPYASIVLRLAKNTFYTYKNLFGMVGFELEDVVNIGRIHLVSFLGLFSLERSPEKYQDFVDVFHNKNFSKPKESDFMDKNKANCTLFLKQRMEDVVRVCRQKARNIKGLPTEEYYFYSSVKNPPLVLRDLVENHEKLGFKKLDTAVYKSIRKKVKNVDGPVFKFNKRFYVAVPVEQKTLSVADFSGAGMDPYDSLHNMSPEDIYFSLESADVWDKRQQEFDKKPKHSKARMMKAFVEKNKSNPKFAEEVRAARKILKDIGA